MTILKNDLLEVELNAKGAEIIKMCIRDRLKKT